MGCAAALDDGAIAALPSVVRVAAGADLDAIGDALGIAPELRVAATRGQSGTRALLRIQDGCDEHCTFCATTLARGANRSRDADAVVAEAAALADRHPEIVLTGVHIGTWGRDVGSTLGALVHRLVQEVPDVRFRLTSVEATEVDAELAELFGEPARLAPHVHAPLQSGSDRVLKRMGRHWYREADYAASVERLAARLPVFGLGADIIAGFPGETDDDHAATVALVEALPFTYLHVFPYSARPGTAAPRLPGAVPAAVASARAADLRAAGAAKAAAHRGRRLGRSADVIVVGDGGRRYGLTEDYLSVALPEPAPPRGTRYAARLDGDAARLIAAPHTSILQ